MQSIVGCEFVTSTVSVPPTILLCISSLEGRQCKTVASALHTFHGVNLVRHLGSTVACNPIEHSAPLCVTLCARCPRKCVAPNSSMRGCFHSPGHGTRFVSLKVVGASPVLSELPLGLLKRDAAPRAVTCWVCGSGRLGCEHVVHGRIGYMVEQACAPTCAMC